MIYHSSLISVAPTFAVYGNVTDLVRNMDSKGSLLIEKMGRLNEFFIAHQVK